ncbi:TonB-dependent siderophore receptor [Variovorax boronicumulans]|uniref:TonB-dependent siderophore receptor n=1 Tax=Variovorax boronicumulans TaxID=436515 RepID=UPI00214B69CD
MAPVRASHSSVHAVSPLRGAVLSLALMAMASVSPQSLAQPAPAAGEARVRFDIPAGTLDQNLVRFGRQSGLQITVNAELTAGLRSPGVSGSHPADDALRQLLGGTGLSAQRGGSGEYTLRRAPPSATPADAGAAGTLPAVTVSADAATADRLPPAYAGAQVARGGRAGLLGNKDFLETPFNLTSFTAEGIQDQQARTIGDVVKNDPSVRTIWPDGSYINQFTIRGFPTQTSDMAVNGLYGIVAPQMTGGLESIERVELLKGPGALLNGMAPTGGIGGNINLVTKRAGDEPLTQLTTSYYASAQFGQHLDLGRRFGDDKQWGLRFNGAYRDGDTGVDDQSQRAGSATLGLDYRGDRVRLSADLGYHDMRTDAPTRIAYTDNANFQIPRAPDNTLSLGQPWYFAKSQDRFGMVQGEVDIAPGLTAFAAVGGRRNEFLGLYNFIYLRNALGDFRANQYYQPTYSDTRTAMAGLRGQFDTGSVRHEINLNLSTLHTESGVLAPVISTYTGNMYRPPVIAQPALTGYASTAPKTAESDLRSIAIADTLHFLDDRVQLTLGLRQQSVEVQNFNAATGAPTTAYDKERVTPAAALVVRVSQAFSVYGNYIEGLSQGPSAPAGTRNAGEVFAPLRARQVEAGAKYDFGRFAVTASVFQIEQPSGLTDSATNTYRVDGEQRNRGIELNTFGEVARGIRLLGGVTFMKGVQTRTANGLFDGNKAIGVPTTQFNLGSEWDLPAVQGLTLTGRLIYTSSQYYNAANTQSIPAWTRVDIGARYRTRIADLPATLRVGIENLADKDYWAAASSAFGLARGAPRTFLLSATFDF